jgi:hypothetical protein
MDWHSIIITDKSNKVYKGKAAQTFFETNCPDAPLTTYTKGLISITFTSGKRAGKKSIQPDHVKGVIWAYLKSNVKEVMVDGTHYTNPVPKPMVPQKKQNNPINVVAEYTITLELGDIDALFEPIGSTAEPWKEKGVQERLQVLGYLYTPLEHPGNKGPDFHHAKACWEYYKRVHNNEPDNAVAVGKLKEEIYGNLLAKSFPKSGVILEKSKLPATGEFAAIRFPGGYCITKAPTCDLYQGDFFFNKNKKSVLAPKYVYDIGIPRDKIEKIVFDDNPLLGKLPMIAKVTAKWTDGKIEPVPDVPVLFQLVMPDAVPSSSPFAPPVLPDKVMNYSMDGTYWTTDAFPKHNKAVAEELTEIEWKAVHKLTKAAYAKEPGDAENLAKSWIDIWVTTAMDYSGMEDWWGSGKKPDKLTIKGGGDALKKKINSVIYDTPPATPPKVMPPISPGNWQAFLLLAKKAKEQHPDDFLAAKSLAEGWINKWGSKSPVEWDDISDWWTGVATVPYPEPDKKHLVTFTDKIPSAMCQPPTSDPAQFNKIPQPEWDSFYLLAKKARETHPADISEARKLAEKWVDQWAAAAGFGWKNVKDWWGLETDTPYTVLDPTKKAKAGNVVKFLLADRTKVVAPEKTGVGQKKFIDDLLNDVESKLPPTDPQKRNAPRAVYGGKAGAGIEEIFDKPSAQMDGFHTKRPAQATDFGTLKLATLPADAVANPHAMECKTNAEGFAGVVFKPSHCGGDAYKIRAYIDPDWLAKKPSSVVHKSVVETGTMTVWRNIRLNRYLQFRKHWTSVADISPALSELFTKDGSDFAGADKAKFDLMYLTTPLTKLAVVPGDNGATPGTNPEGSYPPLGIDYLLKDADPNDSDAFRGQMLKYRPIEVSATHLEAHFKQGYCEWIADCASVEAISDLQHSEAIEKGKAAFEACPTTSIKLVWDKFLLTDPTSPFFLNMRSFVDYNSSLLPSEKTATIDNNSSTHGDSFTFGMEYFWCGVAEYFSGGGVCPGLTIVQLPRADTWDAYCMKKGMIPSCITSGYATASRTVYVSWTDGKYKSSFIYPATANCLHEIGHTLGIAHQYAGGGWVDDSHQKAVRTQFKTPDDDECVCVMSYTGCYGDLCGKCILSLRGWRTHT